MRLHLKNSTAKRRPKTPTRPKALKDGSVPEKVIQKQILDWLKATELLHWRQNSGNVFVGKRMIRLGDIGLPDIVIVIPPNGRLLGMEIKSAKGRLRPEQEEFMRAARNCGAFYRVVRSLDQAMDAVAETMGVEQWNQLQQSGPKSK